MGFSAGPAILYVGVPAAIAPTVRLRTTRTPTRTLQGGDRPRPQRSESVINNIQGDPAQRQRQFVRVIPNPSPPDGARLVRDPESEQAVRLVMRQIVPVLLGTCEDTPDVRFHPSYVPYHTDYGGPVLPHERFFAGAEASVTAELTEYNERLYGILQSYAGAARFALVGGRPRPQPFPLRGLERSGHVGTMVGREQSGVPLWVVLPYAGKPAFARAGMPGCYRFFCATLDDDSPGPLSTRPRKIRLRWTCQRLPVANSTGYLLYDTASQGLPPVEL